LDLALLVDDPATKNDHLTMSHSRVLGALSKILLLSITCCNKKTRMKIS
jgi:hypothetical protein